MNDAQERFHKAEELALKNTMERLDEILGNTTPQQAFIRTFDMAYALGFVAAVVMHSQGFDIRKIDTSQTTLDID